MHLFHILIYLILAVLIGFVGRKQPIGFSGYFLLSFFMSPVVGVTVLLLSSFSYDHRKNNGLPFPHNTSVNSQK